MPQIFQVLRCYKCSIFQVHQTRKDNKWVCKVCGEKQSVKRHYGIGTGKDCRLHVQKLNNMRGEKEEAIKTLLSEESDCEEIVESCNIGMNNESKLKKESKWSAYIDEPRDVEVDSVEHINNQEIVLEVPQKRKLAKKFTAPTKYFKKMDESMKSSTVDNFNEFQSKVMDNKHNVKTHESPIVSNRLLENAVKICTNSDCQNKIMGKENVNKNSKWSQYIENDEDVHLEISQENNTKLESLFSLSDDNDMDKILEL